MHNKGNGYERGTQQNDAYGSIQIMPDTFYVQVPYINVIGYELQGSLLSDALLMQMRGNVEISASN